MAAGLLGDYNNDGTVNAADYPVWRDNLGLAIALPNEDATPGSVTLEDYDGGSRCIACAFAATQAGRTVLVYGRQCNARINRTSSACTFDARVQMT